MDIKSYLSSVSIQTKNYLDKYDTTYLLQIKDQLEEYFSADESCLFSYNSDTLTIRNMFDKLSKSMVLNQGLIHEAMSTPSILCLSRVNSHKLYYQDIDNIYNIKIKSILIVPIKNNNNISGVFVLYKEIRNKKIFTQDNVRDIELFLPHLQKLINVIEGNVKNHRANIPHLEKRVKVSQREHPHNANNKNFELELEIKALKSILHDVKKENKNLNEKLIILEEEKISSEMQLEKQIDTLKEQHTTLEKLHKSVIGDNDQILIKLKQDNAKLHALYDRLEKENKSKKDIEKTYKKLVAKYDLFVERYIEREQETKNVIAKYQKNYAELKKAYEKKSVDYDENIEALKKKNIFLSQENNKKTKQGAKDSEITEVILLENRLDYYENKVKKLELEKSKIEKQFSAEISHMFLFSEQKSETQNIGNILCALNTKFNNNKYAYMFFQFILYALDSNETLTLVNEKLNNSKLIFDILEPYTLPIGINKYHDTYDFSLLIKNIKSYEKKLFSKPINIIINKDKLMPNTVTIDMPKMQSVIYYLLLDLSVFIDVDEKFTIDINHDKSFIFIDISGKVMNNKPTLVRLYGKGPVKDISKRPELQFARILLNSLDTDIEPYYKGRYYKLSFRMPYNNSK